MKKYYLYILIISLIITSIYTTNCSENNIKNIENISSTNKPNSLFTEIYRNGFVTKHKNFDLSKKIPENTIMNILWCGNRLINKKENRYTHLIYFANLTDLYLLNKEGVHLYNPKTNKLITLNENNKVNDIKRIFNIEANHYIMIAISSDMQRLIKGIEYSIMKQFNNKELLENTKLAHIDKKNILEEAAIIEAGSVVNNIMLSASAHNIAHYHVNILNKANITKTTLNIRKNHSTPFILIPIAQKKDTKTNKDKEKLITQYLFKLIKNKNLKLKPNISYKDYINPKKIIELLWAGNGFVKNKKNSPIHISGMPDSFIRLYYVTPKTVQKYDPASNSIILSKTSPYTHKLKRILRQYKVSNSIIISRKQYIRNTYTKKYIKNTYTKKDIRNITLLQIGIALQNIRHRATDLGIKYRFLKIQPEERKNISTKLILKRDSEPIFIIPIAKNK